MLKDISRKCCRNPNVEVRAALFASQQLEEEKALDEMMISETSSALNDADNLLDGAKKVRTINDILSKKAIR